MSTSLLQKIIRATEEHEVKKHQQQQQQQQQTNGKKRRQEQPTAVVKELSPDELAKQQCKLLLAVDKAFASPPVKRHVGHCRSKKTEAAVSIRSAVRKVEKDEPVVTKKKFMAVKKRKALSKLAKELKKQKVPKL